jgi:hypothetical protein
MMEIPGKTIWGDVEIGDRIGEMFVVRDIKHLPNDRMSIMVEDLTERLRDRYTWFEVHFDEPIEEQRGPHGEPYVPSPGSKIHTKLIEENPKKGVTYLAVMPRARKPKAVSKGDVGYYQRHARLFYEAPGMTAAEARQAIKEGILQPTWEKGRPVVAYDVETGRGRTETRIFLTDLMKQVEESRDRNVVLRIGQDIYQPEYSYWHGGPKMTWHKVGLSGFTYDPAPMTQGDLEKHLRRNDTWEMAWFSEDYNGVPMAGFVVAARSGRNLSVINEDWYRQQSMTLSGRRFRTTQIVDGGMLRPADLEFPW